MSLSLNNSIKTSARLNVSEQQNSVHFTYFTYFKKQEAQLLPSDRAMRRVS